MVFLESKMFSRRAAELLPDEDLRLLQVSLLFRPDQGSVISGGSGLRKMRWGLPGRGKSGGARIIYYWFVAEQVVYLLAIYPKNEQADLTSDQLKLLRQAVKSEFK